MNLVISCNLKPHSHTRILARCAFDAMSELNAPVDLIDVQDYAAPLETGDTEHPEMLALASQISAANSVLLAAPIYHFDVAATAKQLVELTGSAWRHKVVGFLGTAAGRRNYMSMLGLANSLMLEFRCLIVPYFVIATPKSFEDEELTDRRAIRRINDLVETTAQWSAAAAAMRESRQIRRTH